MGVGAGSLNLKIVAAGQVHEGFTFGVSVDAAPSLVFSVEVACDNVREIEIKEVWKTG